MSTPRSAATRSLTVRTATRRGCVTQRRRPSCGAHTFASSRNWGTCVDLPLPVSPTTRTVLWPRTAASTSSLAAKTGSDGSFATRGRLGWRLAKASFVKEAAVISIAVCCCSAFTACAAVCC